MDFVSGKPGRVVDRGVSMLFVLYDYTQQMRMKPIPGRFPGRLLISW